MNRESANTNRDISRPIALILAGYNKVDSKKAERMRQEIIEAYDGNEIFIGKNKFLQTLGTKPVIEYVIEAVCGAKKEGRDLYDRIYVYNDIESLTQCIDTAKYPRLLIKQMSESVGGHIKDLYQNEIDYGQRVDVFFGDTPRITSEDVQWVHENFNTLLGEKKDHRGVTINILFGQVDYEDMKDTWLEHRIRFIKRGPNKGKLKNFVGFEDYQTRVGNAAGFIKYKGLDGIVEHEVINYLYNMRMILTPSSFSKMVYHIMRSKNRDLVKQILNRCIKLETVIDVMIDVVEKMYKIDLSDMGMTIFVMRKNASRWENDIDGPRDLEEFRKRLTELVH